MPPLKWPCRNADALLVRAKRRLLSYWEARQAARQRDEWAIGRPAIASEPEGRRPARPTPSGTHPRTVTVALTLDDR